MGEIAMTKRMASGLGVGFVLLALLVLSSCGKTRIPDWETYTSKDKLYKIDYPHGWHIALNGNTFTVTPPDETGSVAVSAYLHPGPSFDQPAFQYMVMRDFSDCREEEPFSPVKGENWEGEAAVYKREVRGQNVIWFFQIAHRGQVGVFVAVNELEIHLKAHKPNYDQVMKSLVILDPVPTPIPVQPGATPTKMPWQERLIGFIKKTE